MSEPSRFGWPGILKHLLPQVLESGETVLAVQKVQLPFGSYARLGRTRGDDQRRLRQMPEAVRRAADEQRSGTRRPRGAADRIGDAATWPLAPTWPWNRWDWTGLWFGVNADGPAGSAAHRMWRALDQENGGVFLLVTDRRLQLLRQPPTFGDNERLVPLFALPRHEVVRARRRDRVLSHGRLRLTFADGSTLTVQPGLFSPRPARKLAKALRG